MKKYVLFIAFINAFILFCFFTAFHENQLFMEDKDLSFVIFCYGLVSLVGYALSAYLTYDRLSEKTTESEKNIISISLISFRGFLILSEILVFYWLTDIKDIETEISVKHIIVPFFVQYVFLLFFPKKIILNFFSQESNLEKKEKVHKLKAAN